MRGEEVSHEVIGFFRLGKVRVVPKGVGKAFKHDELSAVVAGAEECAMENGGAAKKDVAAAGDEESGRHSVKIGEEGREDGIARVGGAKVIRIGWGRGRWIEMAEEPVECVHGLRIAAA